MPEKEELLLRPARTRTLLILLGSIVMVGAGVWLLSDVPVIGWPNIVFFGLVGLLALVSLVPGSVVLRLGPDGFTVTTFFFRQHYHWADVTAFRVLSSAGSSVVAFNFTGAYKVGWLQKIGRRTTGYAEGLPCRFGGLTVGQLADLMNDWRNRYRDRRDGEGIDSATDPSEPGTEALPPRRGRNPGEGDHPHL